MGTHPIFESDFDCLTEEREMGTAFTKVGSRVGPNGTQFIGDIQGSAKYGLPLKSHPVQDVIPKREPINYIRNTLYPKAGSKFMLLQDNTPWSHITMVFTGVHGDTVTNAQTFIWLYWSPPLAICGPPILLMAVNSTNHGEEAIPSCMVPLARTFTKNML